MRATSREVEGGGVGIVRPFAGGRRLQPDHFEPEHVPAEVRAFETPSEILAVGSPGKVGILELTFEVRGEGDRERTELVHHYQKSPLQIMRPLYYDESRPDIPYTYLMTTGGGVLHGDRTRYDLTFGPGSSSHTTTQAHTKLYRMEYGYATALINIDVAADAYVEYLPDPIIPFAGSRYYQRTSAVLDPSATLVMGETLYAGRLTRDERHAYDVYAADLTVTDPDGTPVLVDRCRLMPARTSVQGLGVLADHDVVSTMYAISPLASPAELAEQLHGALASFDDVLWFGVSTLPADRGAWVRMLSDDTVAIAAANRVAWRTIREVLTGTAPTDIRK